MQFARSGRWLMVARVSGPSHNLLQLDLAQAADAPSIEVLPAAGPMPARPLDAKEVLRHVIAGVDAANRASGTSYLVRVARYVADDSRPESVYEELAFALVEHLASGAAFWKLPRRQG